MPFDPNQHMQQLQREASFRRAGDHHNQVMRRAGARGGGGSLFGFLVLLGVIVFFARDPQLRAEVMAWVENFLAEHAG
ncbi:hypothetical protein [Streptomyces mesophilus]|uniref:hypothetical protein n=1 Tax=Streptomyces mesophilus TaxID=1775132 RepID=UPI00332800EA